MGFLDPGVVGVSSAIVFRTGTGPWWVRPSPATHNPVRSPRGVGLGPGPSPGPPCPSGLPTRPDSDSFSASWPPTVGPVSRGYPPVSPNVGRSWCVPVRRVLWVTPHLVVSRDAPRVPRESRSRPVEEVDFRKFPDRGSVVVPSFPSVRLVPRLCRTH